MINTSPIGQTDLTSYFTWDNQMMYHQPLKISRAVEVGWDQSSSLYEEGDIVTSKSEPQNILTCPSGTGVRILMETGP